MSARARRCLRSIGASEPVLTTEDDLQKDCVFWFSVQYPKLAPLLLHVPNEGKRSYRTGATLKAMGMRTGAPDLILLHSNGESPFLCIEMKLPGRYQSKEQKEYEKLVNSTGGKYIVIKTLYDFITEIRRYMSTKNEQFSDNRQAGP